MNNRSELYNILEIANAHGGSIGYIYETIDEFSTFKEKTGFKFHPFHFDEIALKDYEWYSVYKKLFFSEV